MQEDLFKKILIFGEENCGLIANLKDGFHQIGYSQVTTVVTQTDPFFSANKYDVLLQKPIRTTKGAKAILSHFFNVLRWKLSISFFETFSYYNQDLYVFTWKTLKKDFKDVQVLARKKKPMVFLFIGSDVRWIEAFKQEFPANAYKGQPSENWEMKFKFIRTAEINAAAIFSVPDQSSLFIRGYFHMFMPLNAETINCKISEADIPLIIHAPSKRDIKGTSLILQAVKQLKEEGVQFDFEMVEGVSNAELTQKLSEADILIDQLYLNGPATLSTEAMAAGCAVATRFLKDYGLTKEAPVCYIDEYTLIDGLRKLITDKEYRVKLAKRGRAFVIKNNAPGAIAAKIIESISRDTRGDYDYQPSFFKEKFRLPDQYKYSAEIAALNKKVLEKYS